MRVRRYKEGEEKEIWELYYNTTRKILCKDYTQEQLERWAPDDIDLDKWKARLESKNPFVAVHDDELVGVAELEGDGHIDHFYARHDWQGKGVGKRLFKAIEAEARKQGIHVLYADVSVTAETFFLGQGFRTIEEEELLVAGSPAKRFRMEKTVAGKEKKK